MGYKRETFNVSAAPSAVGAYTQGVVHNGMYLFSGMLGLNPDTMELENSFDGQLERIMKNIDGLLEGVGLTRENIIKTTIFMVDLKEFAKVNAAYESYFEQPFPARSCVQVSALPKAAEIEIEVIAAK